MHQVKVIFTCAIIALSWNIISAQLYINEFQASNGSSVIDMETKEFSDWIEIYNSGSEAINFHRYYLSDDPRYLQKWSLPNTSISANGFMRVWADKLDAQFHTNFKLDGDGECIFLVDETGAIVDSVCFGKHYPNISQGRNPDGGTWYYYDRPTPGESNHNLCYALSSIPLRNVEFSPTPGFYENTVQVSLNHPDTAVNIYYTLNGSEPDTASIFYVNPITINATQVIRAKAFKTGCMSGTDLSATYFIGEQFDIPVISLSFDSSFFWDRDIGIYREDNRSVDYSQERKVNLEIFDSRNEYISMGAGARLYGAQSRFLPMASLALFARDEYGVNNIKSKLFDDKEIKKFKSVVLRNSGSDWVHTMFRDALQQYIVSDRMDIDYQAYQPSVVFFNGEYWGIHNIREKLNEDYLAANHGVNPDSVDILFRHNVVIEGRADDYNDLFNYFRNNRPIEEDDYNVLKDWMDIDEFMNYRIAQIYFHNEDWPHNNSKHWRAQNQNGKWRWMLYDLDFGFGGAGETDNMVAWATHPDNYLNYIFNRLLENTKFRNEFLQRIRAHMATTFKADRVVSLTNSMQHVLQPYMLRHIERWNKPDSYQQWEHEVNRLRVFAEQRLARLQNNLNRHFHIYDDVTLSVINMNPEMGDLFICDVHIPDTFSGQFYDDIPIRVEAVPASGYEFIGWTGVVNNTRKEISFSMLQDENLVAQFAPSTSINNLFINEVLSKNSNGLSDENNEYEDWIELFNGGNDIVNLNGIMLTDTKTQLGKHTIQLSGEAMYLQPNDKVIFYADGEQTRGAHLNFKLNADGETIFLSQMLGMDTVIIDSLQYGKQYPNVSYGRIPDGSNNVCYMQPTPYTINKNFEMVTGVLINEFSAHNTSFNPDANNEYSDWIEFHNTNDHPVDIGGMFITDSLPNSFRYRITHDYPDSTTIQPGGYLVFKADNNSDAGVLHTNFNLSRSGEHIGLALPDGSTYVDSISYSKQYRNASLSRYPNATNQWSCIPPTPLAENIYKPVTGLIINEFSAHNTTLLFDGNDDSSDWIEIYNTNNYDVNIGGLYMTDSLDHPTKHRISTQYPDSTIISAHNYLVLLADNKPDMGVLHLNFSLSRSGEQVGVMDHTTEIIDTISYHRQYKNSSYSRYPNASDNWMTIPSTPSAANEYYLIDNIYINEFSASNTQFADEYNEYDDWIELYNANNFDVNIAGYYLTDSLEHRNKCRIPSTEVELTTIPANDYLILWADKQEEQGINHLGFKLSHKGEEIGLFHPELSIADKLVYGKTEVNSGISRYPDGNFTWIPLPLTPGSTNQLPDYSNIVINEVAPVNRGETTDEFNEYDDWIEIYNNNPYPVNIGGLYLSDDLDNPTKCRIPTNNPDSTTIDSYSYTLFWADDSVEQGTKHLNFKISKIGESIGLYSEYAIKPHFIDYAGVGSIYNYNSFGRSIQNPLSWKYFSIGTPKRKNEEVNNLSSSIHTSYSCFIQNPFSNSLQCVITNNITSNGTIHLYNTNGDKLIVYNINPTSSVRNEYLLNTTYLPAGSYYVVISLHDKTEVIKAVKY